jgi:hypothetical protein
MKEPQIKSNHLINQSKYKRSRVFIYGSILLLSIHALIGFLQTPQEVVETAIAHGLSVSNVKGGYAVSILFIYAIPIPGSIVLLSLFAKSKRNIASASKILFWCLAVMLFFNLWFGFVYGPQASKNIDFDQLLSPPEEMKDNG